MTVSKKLRAQIRALLAASDQYDAATMRIDRAGMVSAIKDADKTFNGPHSMRLAVGHVDDIRKGI